MKVYKYINMAIAQEACARGRGGDAGTAAALRSYGDFCTLVRGLGPYLDALNSGKVPDDYYPPNLLRLFASLARHGYRMDREGRPGAGMLALLGDPDYLRDTIGKSDQLGGRQVDELVQRYGERILLDPKRSTDLFLDLGRMTDMEGAVFFDTAGNLVGAGHHINRVDIDRVSPDSFLTIRKLKRNGHPHTTAERHLAALSATAGLDNPICAVVTSETAHTTISMANGDVLPELVYDPESGLYGPSYFRHLGLQPTANALRSGEGVVSGA